jgi:hypothetical protein
VGDDTAKPVPAAEHRGCGFHATLLDEIPNAARAQFTYVVGQTWDLVGRSPVGHGILGDRRPVTSPIPAETEVVTNDERARLELAEQQVEKRLGPQLSYVVIEGNDLDVVSAVTPEEVVLLVRQQEATQRALGPQKRDRVWLERDDNQTGTALGGDLPSSAEQVLVASVDRVKVANRQDGAREPNSKLAGRWIIQRSRHSPS